MTTSLLASFNFWSAFSGLLGSIILFFFGLPPKIDLEGHQHLILEQVDEEEMKKGKLFKKLGYLGLIFLTLSFLIQVIGLLT